MDTNNEVDSFLKGLDEPKEDLFNPIPAVEEVKPTEEKPLPFNQDPKITKFIEREVEKKIKDRLADFQPSATETFQKETQEQSDEISEVLTRIIGNDTPEKLLAIKDFKKVLSGLEEKGAQKALAQLQERAHEEQQAEREAQNELAEGFENIENTFNVDLTSEKSKEERSKFVDFIKAIAPKDSEGQVTEFPDLTESYRLFKQTNKPESNNRAKELASRGMQRSGEASTATNTDKSWSSVEKFFNSLSSK